ncbi:MAG: IS3 family transposase [Gemmatimonadota bacterium]|nr:MAG: IS3 family transposase [Gemmatimonadota bacterium]
MKLARSTYYRRPDAGRHRARQAAETTVRAATEEVVAEWPAYGYRRVTHELKRRGMRVNHKRVARVMREEALTPRRIRRFLATTDSQHAEPVFPNLLPQVCPTGLNQVWVADLTYIRLRREFAYLAVILDACSRKVVGYAVSHLLDARLPLAALDAALESRRPPPGLIHHSDRGVQYASRVYRGRLAEHRIRGSMSRVGNPYDNAQVESFLKTLKHEEVYVNEYDTMQDVIDRLPYFLEEVYNRKRLHSALGYRPPEEYEALFTCSAT